MLQCHLLDIHAIIALKRGGVPIYHEVFTKHLLASIDVNLVSAFFTAILDFSRAVVQEQLNVMEVGSLRFFFKKIEACDITFVVIADATATVLVIEERLGQIIEAFFKAVPIVECEERNTVIQNDELSAELRNIIQFKDKCDETTIGPMRETLREAMTNGDFLAAALLSSKGEIQHTSLPVGDLKVALREIETRARANIDGNGSKWIYHSGNKLIFSQTIPNPCSRVPLHLILLFDANRANLGMADFMMENIVEKLCVKKEMASAAGMLASP